ncbi:MAG: amidohydrolase [Coriobacteriales bacterium]|nr:amidohydrolase [Coriobacteriales bacterium]
MSVNGEELKIHTPLDPEQDLIEVFKWFHMHPEVGFSEVKTTAKIKELLSLMPGVEMLDLGLETGALARVVGDPSGPVVAFRSDIDALPITEDSGVEYTSLHPGCMHACGHDFHLTNLLGAARILGEIASQNDASSRIPGTVVFVFQPSEEINNGAGKIVATGKLQELGVQQMFGLHVDGSVDSGLVAVKPGPLQAAVNYFTITVRGRGGHAAYPHRTLDPIPAAARMVISLQEIASRAVKPFEPVVVTVGRFTAGTTHNVIPDTAELEGTVRTFNEEVRALVYEKMLQKCKALEAEGYTVDLYWRADCDAVINNPELIDMIRKVAQGLNLKVIDGEAVMGGEDFSEYSKICPTAFFKVGVASPAGGHTPRFRVNAESLPQTAKLTSAILTEALRRLCKSA